MTSVFCSQLCGTLTSNTRDPLKAGCKWSWLSAARSWGIISVCQKYSLIMNDCNITKESSVRKVFHAAINHDWLGVTSDIKWLQDDTMMCCQKRTGQQQALWVTVQQTEGRKWLLRQQHNHVHKPYWTSLAVQGGVTPDLKKVMTFYDDKPTNVCEVSSAWPLILGM